MEMGNYRFEPLNNNNKADYLKVVENCKYAFARAFDEVFVDYKIESGSAAGTVIIYDQKGTPVAAFVGDLERRKAGRIPVYINFLAAYFGGLYIAEDAWDRSRDIKDFIILHVFPSYYEKKLRVAYVALMIPPKMTIEKPEMIFRLLPFYCCAAEVNTILYTPLSNDVLNSFKYNVRYEIKKGMGNLARMQVLRRTDGDILHHMMRLTTIQASALKIAPKPAEHFERILRSKYYNPLVAVMNGQPLAAIIYTCWNGMATFNYNASTYEAQKLFVNKALLYTAMRESFDMGAKYFALGDGKEFSGNMLNVAFFKRSFATHEAVYYRYLYPLSPLGHALLAVRQFKKAGLIRRTLMGEWVKEDGKSG